MSSLLRSVNQLGLRLGSGSLFVLLGLLVSVGITVAGGPGGGDVEMPVGTISSGGASLSATLPNGDTLDVDVTLGAPMAAEGSGSGEYSLISGFQALREAAEESSGPVGTPFRRGDANTDGAVDIGDAIATLGLLFSGGSVSCDDAADSNDDAAINVADGIALLGYLFSGTGDLPAPFPACGVDPTPDALACESYNGC